MASIVSRYLLIFIFLGSCCSDAQADLTAVIDPAVRYQTFEGWGVSLAWWAKVVGGFRDPLRQDFMKKIFDPVKGLGFNIVRYNIGGGENPALHTLSFRARMDGFEPTPGSWNWDADAGQRWVLQQAKARGANIFEAFSDTPPYWMTISGSVTGGKNGNANNLATDHDKDFADYLATVVEHFKEDEGIVFRTLEPFNEPTSNWWQYGKVQEGCHFDPHYQSRLIGLVGRALKERNLTTRVSASDENSINDTLSCFRSYPQQTKDFISKINTHSYNGSQRKELAEAATAAHKTLWQSEYGDADASGITLSRRILTDMRQMHPAAWIYWQAVDGARWGLLTNDMKGTPLPSEPKLGEKYWVMASYTRFIRPGAVFINIRDEHSLAALDATGHILTVVTTNWDDHNERIVYDLSRLEASFAKITAYRTSAIEDLTQLPDFHLIDGHLDAVLPKKSVTTFVLNGVNTQKL